MAEVLAYAPDLTSMTGGRGDYSMSLLRYEEVPAHVAQSLIAAANEGEGAGEGLAGVAGATWAARRSRSAPAASPEGR